MAVWWAAAPRFRGRLRLPVRFGGRAGCLPVSGSLRPGLGRRWRSAWRCPGHPQVTPLSVLLIPALGFLSIGSVSGATQHPAEVDNCLDIDVLMRRDVEEFGSGPDCDGNHPIALLHDRADGLQQGDHGMPLDVVAHGMLEDLAQRIAVMIVEMHRL